MYDNDPKIQCMITKNKEIILIGGGILGLSLARKFLIEGYKNIRLLEKEDSIAKHQSSRNSGVMHAGLYYEPNSLKSKLSREGIVLMKEYCNKNLIDWDECGKIVVASKNDEINRLENLFERGKKNNLKGLKILNSKEINTFEPYVDAKAGILVPEESIVSYLDVAKKFQEEIISMGGLISFSSEVINIEESLNSYLINLKNGEKLFADIIISTTGLFSDKTANMMGLNIENKKILPFRGEYFLLDSSYKFLVKNLIYPVPNPSLPFLGVHLTRMINGDIEAGPNAILALAREGYNWSTINFQELYESITYIGIRKFIQRYPMTTAGEVIRSLFKEIFVKSIQKIIPDIKSKMLIPAPSGIRAQLMNPNGTLVQDFDIRIKGNLISVLNAPSPAATSSLSIASYIFKRLTD